MAQRRVYFDVNSKEAKEKPAAWRRAIRQGVGQVMEYAEIRAKFHCPSSVGKGTKGGRGGISHIVTQEGDVITGTLTAVARNKDSGYNYLFSVHEGSGLFGPRKARIYPRVKRVLAWTAPGIPRPRTAQEWKMLRIKGLAFFARSIKGQRPNPFLKKGLDDAKAKAPGIFDRAVQGMNKG